MAYQHKTNLNLLIEAGHHSPQQVLHDVSERIIIVVNVNVNLCTMFLPVFILTTAWRWRVVSPRLWTEKK